MLCDVSPWDWNQSGLRSSCALTLPPAQSLYTQFTRLPAHLSPVCASHPIPSPHSHGEAWCLLRAPPPSNTSLTLPAPLVTFFLPLFPAPPPSCSPVLSFCSPGTQSHLLPPTLCSEFLSLPLLVPSTGLWFRLCPKPRSLLV